MTIDEIRHLLSNPSQINGTQYSELERLVHLYPYCASLKFLYLQALSLRQDARYASELKRLTVHLPDRGFLYKIVEGDAALPTRSLADEEDGFALIDAFLNQEQVAGVDLPQELSYAHTASDDYFAMSSDHLEADSLPLDTPTTPPEQPSTEATIKVESNTEYSAQDTEGELFTETLAKIYIKQGHYDKALRIIKSLNLQYPEKNSYFAEQLRFLELLSSNDKAI